MSRSSRPCLRRARTRRRLARAGSLAAAATLSLVISGCGGGTTDVAQQAPAEREVDPLDALSAEELVAQAEEEGEVVVYSFTSRIAEVEAAFEQAYPGVDLVGNDIASTEQVARIRAEANAGTAGADVAYLADAPVVLEELVDTGLVRRYVPPRLAEVLPEQYQEPLLSQRLSTKVLMYNEQAHPDGSPVTNLWELTEDDWSGRVIMVDPAVRGDYLDLVTEVVLRSEEMEAAYEELNDEPLELDEGVADAGSQWVKDLYENDLVLVDDTDNVNAAVGSLDQEQPPVGITSYSDRRDNEEEGWALQVAGEVTPSPGIAYPAYVGLVDGAENPAAARLLVDFLMGDDSETGGPGYAPFYVAGDYVTREDLTDPEEAVSLEELGAWVIDPEEVITRRAEVGDFLLTLD